MENIPYISYYKDQFVNSNELSLSLANRGLRYGDALFESIRVLNGKVPFINHHIDRLLVGMKQVKMICPPDLNSLQLTGIINELVQKNESPNARLRLSVIRRDGGFYRPSSDEVDLLIEFTGLPGSYFELNEEGLVIDAYMEMKKPANHLSTLKCGSSLFYVLAGIYARENNLDECLLLNEEDMVAEALHSNIFIFQNKSIYTPPLKEYCINGVMRSVVLDLAQEINYSVEETPLTMAQVMAADEVMLTNAVTGLKWVKKFREKTYVNDHIKEWVVSLNDKYVQVIT